MTLPAVLKAPMMEMRMLAWVLVKPRSSDILIAHSQYYTVDYIKPTAFIEPFNCHINRILTLPQEKSD